MSAGFIAIELADLIDSLPTTAGSVTTLAGNVSLQGPEVERHVEHFAELAEKSGYSEHVARSTITWHFTRNTL